jgi:hypothetical protein
MTAEWAGAQAWVAFQIALNSNEELLLRYLRPRLPGQAVLADAAATRTATAAAAAAAACAASAAAAAGGAAAEEAALPSSSGLVAALEQQMSQLQAAPQLLAAGGQQVAGSSLSLIQLNRASFLALFKDGNECIKCECPKPCMFSEGMGGFLCSKCFATV